MAAQLIATKGPRARGPLACRTWATRPLPVPVSPCSNTVGAATLPSVSKGARWRIWVCKACMAGDCPTSWAVGSGAGRDPELAIGILHGAAPQHRGQDARWPPQMAEMAADGGHCILSCGTTQAVCRVDTAAQRQETLWHGFCFVRHP